MSNVSPGYDRTVSQFTDIVAHNKLDDAHLPCVALQATDVFQFDVGRVVREITGYASN